MDNRIDFSPLDLRRDRTRYERLVQVVVARVRAGGVVPFAKVLLHRGRAALALAIIIALAAWWPNLLNREAEVASSKGAELDLVDVVTAWADSGKVPSDVDLDQSWGARDER